jgi:flagellar biogenesis protein FliO
MPRPASSALLCVAAFVGALVFFAPPLTVGAEQGRSPRTPWSSQSAQGASPHGPRDAEEPRRPSVQPAGFAREVDGDPADRGPESERGSGLDWPDRRSAALAPRSVSRGKSVPLPAERPLARPVDLSPLLTTGASLAVVVGLFLLVAWALRRKLPQASTPLPAGVLEVLGRGSLPGKHSLHVVRCGAKLLLVCTSPTGPKTLTEISDPDEVARLTALCREANPRSSSRAFREVLREMDREPHAPGFADTISPASQGPRAAEARRA